jgi:hypothetical protein
MKDQCKQQWEGEALGQELWSLFFFAQDEKHAVLSYGVVCVEEEGGSL